MDRAEIQELVRHEVRDIVSPRMLGTLVALVISLLLGCAFLWNLAVTNQSWIISLNGQVKGLQAEQGVAEALREQNALLEQIAAAVGAAEQEK